MPDDDLLTLPPSGSATRVDVPPLPSIQYDENGQPVGFGSTGQKDVDVAGMLRIPGATGAPPMPQPPPWLQGAGPGLLQSLAPRLVPTAQRVVAGAGGPAPTPLPTPPPATGAPLAVPSRTAVPHPPKPTYRDPLMALGNPLTVLAMLGSLFTRRPAVTALKAAGAAMKAQSEADQTAYTNAYTQYQGELRRVHEETLRENADYKRDWENRRLSLQERLASMRRTATRRGDRAMNTALDSGSPDAPEKILKAREDAAHLLDEGLTEAQAVREMIAKNPSLSKNEARGVYQRMKAYKKEEERTGKPLTLAQQKAKAVDELVADGMSVDEAIRKVEGKEPKPATMAQEQARAVEELMAANPHMTRTEAIQQVKAKQGSGAGMSGNKRVQEEQRDFAITESLTVIDKAIATVNKYRLAAGAAGMVLRGKERLENVFGGDDAERDQFMRNIQYLRLMFPRIAAGSGRPLAAEAKRVDDFVGGISMGDTTTNTIKSLEELRDMYLRMHDNQRRILEGGAGAAPAPAAPAASPPPAAPTEPAAPEVDWDAFPKAK